MCVSGEGWGGTDASSSLKERNCKTKVKFMHVKIKVEKRPCGRPAVNHDFYAQRWRTDQQDPHFGDKSD